MIRVLHLGTEKTWRGGENQMRLLIEGLKGQVEAQFAATPADSVAYIENRWACSMLALKSGNPWSLFNVFRIVRFIRDNKINIVDAHTAKAHTLALNACRFLPGVKIVVHRRVDNRPKDNVFTRRKYFHPRINRFVAISYSIGQILKDYGLSTELIRVVRSAVSGKTYESLNREQIQGQWRKKLNLAPETILIGNASALSPQKGYETLLRAVVELKKTSHKFAVLIAGDGGLYDELMDLSRSLRVDNLVYFVGFVKDVPDFLSALDILAVPSNNEGLGTIILDGILAGCAVVGSEIGGIPEMIQHEKTGLLQQVGDHKALAQNIEYLIQHPEKRLAFSRKAQELVRSEFSLESMVQGNLQVYQELLKGTK